MQWENWQKPKMSINILCTEVLQKQKNFKQDKQYIYATNKKYYLKILYNLRPIMIKTFAIILLVRNLKNLNTFIAVISYLFISNKRQNKILFSLLGKKLLDVPLMSQIKQFHWRNREIKSNFVAKRV